jgi:hypothetical protein
MNASNPFLASSLIDSSRGLGARRMMTGEHAGADTRLEIFILFATGQDAFGEAGIALRRIDEG